MEEQMLNRELIFKPIGYVRHQHQDVPRHWSCSDLEGELVINPEWQAGLEGLKAGDLVVVLFFFHLSPPFAAEYLRQKPPHGQDFQGVFSLCSPRRPNPIGLSVVKILDIKNK